MPGATRYLVAYSGGRDSHVLLHLLSDARARLSGRALCALHVDHGLHPDSARWARHCVATCEELGVEYEILTVHAAACHGESPEAAAREARYAALAARVGAGDALLLAQHRDDQAETLMLQLLRGAGVRGLAAMPRHAVLGGGWLGRPLLDVPRTAIDDYAARHGLRWVEDPGNQERAFDRNFLRHEVLPLLHQRWPAASATLARAASHQGEAATLLNQLAAQDWRQVALPDDALSVLALGALDEARQRNLLRYWLADQRGLPLPDTRHLQRILHEVAGAAPHAQPCVAWSGAQVRRYRDTLVAQAPLSRHDPERRLVWDLRAPLPLLELGATLHCSDSEGEGLAVVRLASLPLTVRFRQGGERCVPAGRAHHHVLKKLFQEWGVPPWQRDRIPLIFAGEELAQVVGYCVCEPFQARAGERAVVVQMRPLSPSGGR
ncbi:MAG: tRNA lysidine(34) synthetase TilS [Pseudomonadota bacterium]|nr:MAG: tRNA lysidine(34) synthetase TilS [Pseudomonadota bacterium]